MDFDLKDARAGISASAQDSKRESLLEIITHGLRAKAFYDRVTIQTMDVIKEHFDKAYNRAKEAYQKELEKQEEKEQKINILKSQMFEMGLTLHDLFNDPTVKTAQRTYKADQEKAGKPVHVYKYRCHIFGETYWASGAGAVPLPFRCAIAAGEGRALKDFLLEEDEWMKTTTLVRSLVPEGYKEEAKMLLNKYNQMKPPRKYKQRN